MDPPQSRRRRPALSCIECRRRKVKCDRANPCKHCVAAKIVCSYKADPRVSSPLSMQKGLTELVPGRRASTHGPISTRTGPAGAYQPSSEQSWSRVNPAVREIQDGAQVPELSIRSLAAQSLSADELLSVELNAPAKVDMKKTRVAGWCDRMGNDLFSSIMACYKEASGAEQTFSEDAETRATVSEIGELLQNSKRMARRLKASSTPLNNLQSLESCVPPARHIADTMVELYLDSFESAHRILHVPTFRNGYTRYWDGDPTSDEKRLMILLVIAMGSSLSDESTGGDVSRAQACQWVHAAQTWLSGPFDKARLSIAAIQLHCLTLLARLTLCIGADLIWISAGALLNQAMLMGLHREPSHIKGIGQLEAEVRRRLWATILDLTLQASLDRALPPPISLSDYDVDPPSNIDDHELSASEPSRQPHGSSGFTDATIQRLLLRSLPLRLRVVQLLNTLEPRLHYPKVLSLSQELVSACQLSSAELKKYGGTQFRRNLLDYLQQRFLLPLHCLFANKSRCQPLFFYSLKVSFDVASSIAAPPPDVSWNRLMRVAGGMFREGLRYASVTMGMEFLAQVQVQQEVLGYGMNDRELCKRLMQSLLNQSIERVRYGETNIKNPMFLTMVMAQAKAIEEGRSSRLTLAQAARDSLRECYEILEMRKNAMTSDAFANSADQSTATSSFDEMDNFDLGFDLDFFMPDLVL